MLCADAEPGHNLASASSPRQAWHEIRMLMSSTYAPPSHPPPPRSEDRLGGPSHGYANYAPTTVPTPGQALLKNGKMLVYPHGWKGCPKCQDTGYKQGDPSHPCRKCWQDYGQPFNPLLISSSGLQGAKVLQKPLPLRSASFNTGSASMPGGFPPYASTHHTGHAGYPGASQPVYSPPLQTHAPPFHAPPPQHAPAAPPPPARPAVNRPNDSREDDLNEDGEAPPAYEDAVAAGPDGAAPPQRANVDSRPQQNSFSTPPASNPSYTHSPPIHSYPQQQPYFMPMHGPPAMATAHGPQYMAYGQMPPRNALVVRPGDPRIGGRLCYKCGGDGVREDFWFGSSETCRTCGGTGRIM